MTNSEIYGLTAVGLGQELKQELDSFCKFRGYTRSALTRKALRYFMDQVAKEERERLERERKRIRRAYARTRSMGAVL